MSFPDPHHQQPLPPQFPAGAGPGQFPPPGYPQHQQLPPGYPPPGPMPYAPYGVPPAFDAYGRPLSDKSKMSAGLLQLFLGGFGVGRFYLGYSGIGVAQLIVCLFTCGLGCIWPFIDGIMILTGSVPDAQGRPLRD